MIWLLLQELNSDIRTTSSEQFQFIVREMQIIWNKGYFSSSFLSSIKALSQFGSYVFFLYLTGRPPVPLSLKTIETSVWFQHHIYTTKLLCEFHPVNLCYQMLIIHGWENNGEGLICGRKSGLVVGSELDSWAKGHGIESRLIQYKMEMVSKSCHVWFMHHPIMVHSAKKRKKILVAKIGCTKIASKKVWFVAHCLY